MFCDEPYGGRIRFLWIPVIDYHLWDTGSSVLAGLKLLSHWSITIGALVLMYLHILKELCCLGYFPSCYAHLHLLSLLWIVYYTVSDIH